MTVEQLQAMKGGKPAVAQDAPSLPSQGKSVEVVPAEPVAVREPIPSVEITVTLGIEDIRKLSRNAATIYLGLIEEGIAKRNLECSARLYIALQNAAKWKRRKSA